MAPLFEILESIGQGAFGSVMKGFDCKNKRNVAMKIFKPTEENVITALTEITMFRYLEQKPDFRNIAIYYDSFKYKGDYYIVMELLSTNLLDVLIKSVNGIETQNLRIIARSTLNGLDFLHQNGIVHTDLKLDNIVLINQNGFECKIIDFGLSLFTKDIPEWCENYRPLQAIGYRAPEIIIRADFDSKIDIFSFGCIVAHLCIKRFVFPAKKARPNLAEMVEYLGLPPRNIVENSRSGLFYFNLNPTKISFKTFPSSKKVIPKSRSLNDVFKSRKDPNLTDFVKRCLSMDPTTRGSAEQLLKHPWLNETKVKHDCMCILL